MLSLVTPVLDPYSVDDLPPQLAARITIDAAAGCWIGSAPLDKDGYARYAGSGLHRAVWAQLVGPLTPGLVLDHREDWGCTSKACAWPMHLVETTVKANTLRGNSFSAVNARKVNCGACGTPYDEANTYLYQGRRQCRACNRAAVRRYKTRLREALAPARLPAAA